MAVRLTGLGARLISEFKRVQFPPLPPKKESRDNMYLDKRYEEVELKLRVEKELQRDRDMTWYDKRLFCMKCNSELTKIFDYNNGEFEINFCPSCGVDLRK